MENWTRGPCIGRGSTATVSQATSLSGKNFAVKSTTNLSHSHFLQKEHQILSKLNSPRIVKYLDYNITLENNIPTYNLCMENITGGSIFDVIQMHGGRLNEHMQRQYTLHVLEGLDYIHKKGVVHCDLKCKNVLVGKDGLKIADFGCAKVVESERCEGFSGTPLFMAPEVVRREQQGFEADIWAVGCMVIEMATGNSPWDGFENPLYRIGFSDDVPEFPSGMSEDGKDFLSKCLQRDAKERWTAEELLKHPFVGQVVDKFDDFLIMKSPNAVLCHRFWDGLDGSGCDKEDVVREGFSSCSPADKIGMLAGGVRSMDFDWNCDENWITIRENDSVVLDKSCVRISNIEMSVSSVEVMNSDAPEEYTSLSISDEHRQFEFYVEHIDITHNWSSERIFPTAYNSAKDENVSYYYPPIDNESLGVEHILLISYSLHFFSCSKSLLDSEEDFATFMLDMTR